MKRATVALGAVSVLLGLMPIIAQQPSAEQQIVQIIRDIEAARLKKDAATFRRHVADDYTGVSSRGSLLTKADLLTALQRDNFTKYVVDNVKVRTYGDAAVATGRATYTATFEGTNYTDRQIHFTAMYVRRNGQWQEVANQSTVVGAQQK